MSQDSISQFEDYRRLKMKVSTPNIDDESIANQISTLSKTEEYETRYLYPYISRSRVPFWLAVIRASTKINTISVDYGDRVELFPRVRLHGYLCADRGMLKSNTLKQMQSCYPEGEIIQEDYCSYAGMVGTIDKETKMSVVPLAVRIDGKVFIMDERAKEEGGNLNSCLLQITDGWGGYKRVLAIPPKFDRNEYDGRWIVNKETGELIIKSSPSLIYSTMYAPSYLCRTQFGRALLNRCIVLNYKLTEEEKEKFFRSPYPLYQDFGFNPPSDVHISYDDFKFICDFMAENDKTWDLRKGGDLVRCFAVLGKHDIEAYAELLKIGTPIEHSVKRRRYLN